MADSGRNALGEEGGASTATQILGGQRAAREGGERNHFHFDMSNLKNQLSISMSDWVCIFVFSISSFDFISILLLHICLH